MMIFTNEFVNLRPRPLAALRILLPLLSPFAPHLAEELWMSIGEKFPDSQAMRPARIGLFTTKNSSTLRMLSMACK